MATHKNEITLIVESDNLSALEFWYLRQKSLEHTANCMTQSGIEVVQDQFRVVSSDTAMTLQSALAPKTMLYQYRLTEMALAGVKLVSLK